MTPQPGCGTGCLPGPGSFPTVPWPVRVARLLALVGVLLAGAGVVVARRPGWTRAWFRLVLRAAGVRLRADSLVDTGTLVVANHISWLDVPAVLALLPARVVAKTDVRDWPVIGALAARGGTIFIDRRRVKRLPVTVAEVADALCQGDNVLAFAEGTTHCGRTRGRYYPAMFQAAVDAGSPVRPVSIAYRLTDGSTTTAAAFIGDDTLLSSVWRVVSVEGLVASVHPEPVLKAIDYPWPARRALATASRSHRPVPASETGLHRVPLA